MVLQLVLLSLFAFAESFPERDLPGLVVGDKIGFTAIYSSTANRFGLNIEDADGNYIFRLAFRNPSDKSKSPPPPVLVLSTYEGKWVSPFSATFPDMTDGQEISVLIEAQDEKFVGYLNGEVMEGVEMKYRYPLETAAKLRLWGGAAEDGDRRPAPEHRAPVHFAPGIMPQ
ncbi:hypothetical protein ACHWQZ_G001326 [Mnemiopsis leidyi]